ncbi:hypothetical protein TNCV_4210271 [Trichonephila clavipes]|nr:hypothetical protein TNCV_4210271 [Trichonephila clavipes]
MKVYLTNAFSVFQLCSLPLAAAFTPMAGPVGRSEMSVGRTRKHIDLALVRYRGLSTCCVLVLAFCYCASSYP